MYNFIVDRGWEEGQKGEEEKMDEGEMGGKRGREGMRGTE